MHAASVIAETSLARARSAALAGLWAQAVLYTADFVVPATAPLAS